MMRKLLFHIILSFFSLAGYSQSQTFDEINFVDPVMGSNGDNVKIYRSDNASDHSRLWIKLGDEYLTDFNIGYRRYQDGNWVQLFSLNGHGDGYFAGKLGIGTSSLPFEKLTIIDGSVFLGNKTVNKFESGRIRFSEYENTFQGAFIHYNGSDNVLNIGVHQHNDTNVSGDNNSISIKRHTGNVGIGTTTPSEKLEVAGTIYSQEVRVDIDAGTGPDYVFEPSYHLRTLEETEAYIKANKHLPEVPSAAEMEANGVQLGEMNMLLLKKIEELTLHTIEQQKLIEEQGKMIKALTIHYKKLINDL